jgi:membrane associated rhomboid family serine protease
MRNRHLRPLVEPKGVRVSRRQPVFNLPGVILALLAACFVVQLVRDFVSAETDAWIIWTFGFIPALWRWWTPVTYAFVHGDWLHLGLNALWLAAFGSAVARRFGPLRFLGLYLLSGVAGVAAFLLVHPTGLQPVVGASAAISGAVAAAMRFAFEPGGPLGPGRNISLSNENAYYVPALPLGRVFRDGRALTFLLTWFGCNILFGAFATPLGIGDATVAWEAHIGGFLFGLLAFSFFDPAPDQSPAPEPEPELEPSSQASGPRQVP